MSQVLPYPKLQKVSEVLLYSFGEINSNTKNNKEFNTLMRRGLCEYQKGR
jgi:hypothetical protein